MLDMYDFNGDIWLCHSFRGQCFNFTAFVIFLLILSIQQTSLLYFEVVTISVGF